MKTKIILAILTIFIIATLTFSCNRSEKYFNSGIAKYEINDNSGAISDFNKSIEINPKNTRAYFYRGCAKGNLEDYKGSVEDFTKAIETNPKFDSAYFNRGFTKINLKNYIDAIEDFTKVIEINPKYTGIYYQRGFAKFAMKDYPGAIVDLTKNIETERFTEYSYYFRGRAYLEMADYYGSMSYSKSIEDFTAAIGLNSELAVAYHDRSIAKSKMDDYPSAITDLTRSIEIEPDNPENYFFRGLLLNVLGENDQACEDFKMAKKMGADIEISKFCK